MKASDRAIGPALIVLGIAFLGYGYALPPMPGQRYGAGLFPMVIGLALAACGAVQAWRGWRARGERLVTVADWARDPALRANLALTLALILVYALLDDRVGFVPLSIAILFIMFVRLRVPVARAAVVAVLATATIQVMFVNLLRVPLPRGLLKAWIW